MEKSFVKTLRIIDNDHPILIMITPVRKEGMYCVVTDDPFDGVQLHYKYTEELLKKL